MPTSPPALQVADLTVSYRQGKRWLDALRQVSLTIDPGQTYGLVGESGSGKTTLALAVLGYLPPDGRVRAGSIRLAGQDLQALDAHQMQAVWRERVRLVPQNPLSSLNPSLRIGRQLTEGLAGNGGAGTAQARVLDLMRAVHLADPERVADSYPHQLSGGMQQRVMIAMALSAEPALMVLDEPTTNLDVTTEAAILDLFRELIRERDTAVLYVSHNLGVVSSMAGRVAVLYAGELVEDAPVVDLYRRPLHPYSQGLLDSVPRLGQTRRQVELRPIPGSIPRLDQLPPGCVFEPRCPLAVERCRQERPSLEMAQPGRHVRCHRWPEILAGQVAAGRSEVGPGPEPDRPPDVAASRSVLVASNLQKHFAVGRTAGEWLRRLPPRQVRAVDGVDFEIGRGRTLGLVGESGSGKTTVARCVVGLVARSGGEITLLGLPMPEGLQGRDRDALRRLQMVFQNPEEALNPFRTVGDVLRRPLIRLAGLAPGEAEAGVRRLLAAVQLPENYAERLPGQLSGGEKQRVAIARAFASQPDLLIFDESVSALDVSVQASILNLLNELQAEQQSAYLFISHDLSVVGYLADQVAVIYLGQIVETGSSQAIFQPPHHPYTEALLSAIPQLDPEAVEARIPLAGDVPSPVDIPSGCRFHTRCPRFLGEICRTEEPPWQQGPDGHRIRCHIWWEEWGMGNDEGSMMNEE